MKTITFGCLLKPLSAITLATLAQAASAGAILSPVAVYNNTIGNFDDVYGLPEMMIDQSGLSIPFTSGVTDFDAYTAGAPTHLPEDFEGWVGPDKGPFTGVLDFDLGDTYTIERFALWNAAQRPTANVQSFSLFLSSISDFSMATHLGTFTNPEFDINDPVEDRTEPYPASIFDTIDATGRYLRLQVNSHYGNGNVVEIGEVALEIATSAVPVPEPCTLAMLSLALAGFRANRFWPRANQA